MKKSKELLECIAESLVDQKNKISVETKIDELGVLLTLRVAKEDMGRIIGKNGSTVGAIRTLLHVVGKCEDSRVSLKVAEPEQ